ncbi:MAG: helix-turn-helix domain-containing protein [Bacteroidetes bacterium]|nr:helix-turn-helix domain-containing protein [Bacteroidota bacterium]
MNEERFMQELAEVLRQECNAQFKHQQELAYRAGIHPSTLSGIMNANGKKQKITTLLRLCITLRKAPWRILRNAWGPLYDFENEKPLQAPAPKSKKKT